MNRTYIAATTASVLALLASTAILAQENATTAQDDEATGQEVDVLSTWSYEPLYAEGWSVDNMFTVTEVIDINGEEIGDIDNLIFTNEGELLGVIASVGGFWFIGETNVYIPWEDVDMEAGIQRAHVPVTEDAVDDFNIFGAGWFDEEVIAEEDTEEVQTLEGSPVAGPGVFKATDLIGDFVYLTDNVRYGYVSDIIVQDGAISAVVIDAAASGRPGHYAYPYTYRGMGPRYDLPYEPVEVDTIENFDYAQLQSLVTQ